MLFLNLLIVSRISLILYSEILPLLTFKYLVYFLIAPLSEADVDIFIVLDNQYFHHYSGPNGGQAGLLDFLKRA